MPPQLISEVYDNTDHTDHSIYKGCCMLCMNKRLLLLKAFKDYNRDENKFKCKYGHLMYREKEKKILTGCFFNVILMILVKNRRY